MADRDEPDPALQGMTWLRAVAIDKSTPYRGIRVIKTNEVAIWSHRGRLGIYRPFSHKASHLSGSKSDF